MTECQVCNGTGIYDAADFVKLQKITKKHRCEGSCHICGQFFRDEDLDWLYNRLEKIEEKIEHIMNFQLKRETGRKNKNDTN